MCTFLWILSKILLESPALVSMKSNLRRTTELLESVQQSQFVLLWGAFQCKPHQWLNNLAKFIHGVGASLSFFLTVEGERQTAVSWLDPPLENLYWPSLWCKDSSFCDVLHLFLTSLLLFEFLFLLIFGFYFPFLYFTTMDICHESLSWCTLLSVTLQSFGWQAVMDWLEEFTKLLNCAETLSFLLVLCTLSTAGSLHGESFLLSAAVIPNGWSMFHSLVTHP